ncbi:hypothetical protein MMC13_002223 [Lambiella insularis]|nr:hypothetical protein [Lambiella insularis]
MDGGQLLGNCIRSEPHGPGGRILTGSYDRLAVILYEPGSEWDFQVQAAEAQNRPIYVPLGAAGHPAGHPAGANLQNVPLVNPPAASTATTTTTTSKPTVKPEPGAEPGPGVKPIKPIPDSKQVVESAAIAEKSQELTGPPLPQEKVPPLPDEAPPASVNDDGWAPVWDDNAQAYYFYNRFTGTSQWTNPRVPDDKAQPGPPGVGSYDRISEEPPPGTKEPPPPRPYGGYDPSIHGDYDPTAPYAQEAHAAEEGPEQPGDPAAVYAATGAFNRFTGKWQAAALTPENFNDENKSKRQMSAFFDVDAAANSHNGKSLKAERSGKKLSKQELKAFKEKRKEKKEERRRAWLRD